MKKTGLAWGAVAVAVLSGATAEAAPKNAASPATGAAGAAATPPSASAASSAAPPAAGTPGASATPDAAAPPAAVDGTAPAAPDAAATPPVEATSEAEDEEAEEERAREAARRKRKRKRQLQFDAEEDQGDDERRAPLDSVAPAADPAAEPWRMVGSHFLVSVERATNVLGWSVSETSTATTGFNGFPESTSVATVRSGTDVSFLGSGGVSENPFAVPRLAFDGMFSNGLTLGGSLSYLVTSGKHESSSGTTKVSSNDPTTSIFLLAPRIGVVIAASPIIGFWLRGGVTRISRSTDVREINLSTGETSTTDVTSTTTLVDLTLDPQLVISPVPHVGLTLGAALDLGVAGNQETSNSTVTRDVKASSYGVTAGLAAIF